MLESLANLLLLQMNERYKSDFERSYSYATRELDRISSNISNSSYDTPLLNSAVKMTNSVDSGNGIMSFQRGNTKVLIHNSGDVEIETHTDADASEESKSISPGQTYKQRLQFDYDNEMSRDDNRNTSRQNSSTLFSSAANFNKTTPMTEQSKNQSKISSSNIIGSTESRSSSVSVVAAFRDLQDKLRTVESERILALHERDDMRHQLEGVKLRAEVDKSKHRLSAEDQLLAIKVGNDHLNFSNKELQNRLERLRTSEETVQDILKTEKKRYMSLQDINININSDVYEREKKLELLRQQVHDTLSREHELEFQKIKLQNSSNVIITFPDYDYSEESIEQIQHRIHSERKASNRAAIRADAIERYMHLILNINGDLCDTIATRNRARARLSQLSLSHHSSPSKGNLLPDDTSNDFSRSKIRSSYSPSRNILFDTQSAEQTDMSHLIPKRKPMNTATTSTRNIPTQKMTRKRSNSAPPTLRVSSSYPNTSRSHDTSFILSAAREAATAAATASAAAAAAVTLGSGLAKRVFVPSGKQTDKDFNVMASMSKASRAAMNLNSNLSSRVRSSGEGGTYYSGPLLLHEIEKVNEQLAAVKRLSLRSST